MSARAARVVVALALSVVGGFAASEADPPARSAPRVGWRGYVKPGRFTFATIPAGSPARGSTIEVVSAGVRSRLVGRTEWAAARPSEVCVRVAAGTPSLRLSFVSDAADTLVLDLALRQVDREVPLVALAGSSTDSVATESRLRRLVPSGVVVGADLADLPFDWPGYGVLDWLVLGAEDAQSLSAAHQGAIEQWVVAGGQLLVVADSPAVHWGDGLLGSCLPGRIERGVIAVDGPGSRPGPRLVPLPGAVTLVAEQRVPTLLWRRFGDGTVLLYGGPLPEKEGAPAFSVLSKLLSTTRGDAEDDALAASVFRALSAGPTPGLNWLPRACFFLGGSLVLIGLVGAATVRVRETWVRLSIQPVLALLLAMVPLSGWVERDAVSADHATLLEARAGVPWSRVRSFVAFQSSVERSVALLFRGGSVRLSSAATSGQEVEFDAVNQGATSVRVRTRPGESTRLVAEAVLPNPVVLEVRWGRVRETRTLDVINFSSLTLHDPFVYADGRIVAVAELSPGRRVHANLGQVAATSAFAKRPGEAVLLSLLAARNGEWSRVLAGWIETPGVEVLDRSLRRNVAPRTLFLYQLPAAPADATEQLR